MRKLHVLHLEDNDADAFFIRHALETCGLDVEIVVASSREEYLAILNGGGVDLILSDHGLPGFSGSAALNIAYEKHPGIPFIFVFGSTNEKEIEESLNAGAVDYVSKNEPGKLADIIRRVTSGPAGSR